MKIDNESIDLKMTLEERFAIEAVFSSGQGVVTLSPSVTEAQILTPVKSAYVWSQGEAFKVVMCPGGISFCVHRRPRTSSSSLRK